MTTAWIVALVGAAFVLWGAVTFNAFVRLRNRMREAFSGVDVQLRRRHDLVPNLVKVVQGYAAHERQTLQDVVEARGTAAACAETGDREHSESGLSRSLDRLMLLVEAYPDLVADESFRRLHHDLIEIEEQIQYARRYYNGAVRDLNNRIQQFPANLLAPLFGMRVGRFFELASPAEREAPQMALEQE
jgi:LemA protein